MEFTTLVGAAFSNDPTLGESRIFKDRRGRTGPGNGAELGQPWNPSSGQTDFRVIGCQEEKRTLPGAPG